MTRIYDSPNVPGFKHAHPPEQIAKALLAEAEMWRSWRFSMTPPESPKSGPFIASPISSLLSPLCGLFNTPATPFDDRCIGCPVMPNGGKHCTRTAIYFAAEALNDWKLAILNGSHPGGARDRFHQLCADHSAFLFSLQEPKS